MKKSVLLLIVLVLICGCLLTADEREKINAKDPVFINYPTFWFVSQDFKGPYDTIKKSIPVFVENFKKQGLEATGPLLAVYYNSPRLNKKEDLQWALGYSVAADSKVKVEAPLVKHEFKTRPCVVIYYQDFSKPIQDSNDKVHNYINEHGLKTVWPAIEIFHREPSRVEIIHPVEKK